LDKLLGAEKTDYLTEHTLRELITLHAQASQVDIGRMEGTGALNFLAIDDLLVDEEGEILDPKSILELPFQGETAVFPIIERSCEDPFLRQVNQSQRKWVVIIDPAGSPRIVLNADSYLRDALFGTETFHPHRHCHRPILVREDTATLGETIPRLRVHPTHADDDVVDEDIIVFWGTRKRILTGSDILGRLLRGIVDTGDTAFRKQRTNTPGDRAVTF
jgi:hypothetical protein